MVSKLRPPGDVRSKPQTSRAGRWRKGGLAVLTKYRDTDPRPGAVSASMSRDIEARGSAGPPASRAPSDFSEGASADMTRAKTCRGNGGGLALLGNKSAGPALMRHGRELVEKFHLRGAGRQSPDRHHQVRRRVVDRQLGDAERGRAFAGRHRQRRPAAVRPSSRRPPARRAASARLRPRALFLELHRGAAGVRARRRRLALRGHRSRSARSIRSPIRPSTTW